MHIIKRFTATDTFPSQPRKVQVLVYHAQHIDMYVVDIQHQTNDGGWYEDQDPFRSNLVECLKYYSDLLVDSDYSNIVEIV